MAIDKFIYVLLILSISTLFIDIDSKKEISKKKEQPFLIVEDSITYSINKNNVDNIVESKRFSKFKEAEVMEDAIVVSRVQDNQDITDTLSAKFMIKKANDIELIDDVKYNRGHNIQLHTSKLQYNTKTKIARNTVEFTGKYNQNTIDGTHLFLDTKKDIMRSKSTHFDINLGESQ